MRPVRGAGHVGVKGVWRLTQKVLRVFLSASYAAFAAGLGVSAVFYFSARPFDAMEMVISDLESPEDNPRGYGAGAAGTALCGLLLLPAGTLFYDRFSAVHRTTAFAGLAVLTLGLAAAIAMGCLAPFTRDYTPLHVQLAFAAFIGICLGTLVFIVLAAIALSSIARSVGLALIGLGLLNGSILAFLLYLYFTPHFFTNNGLFTSLAFWEWMLCADCAASLWALAAAIEK